MTSTLKREKSPITASTPTKPKTITLKSTPVTSRKALNCNATYLFEKDSRKILQSFVTLPKPIGESCQ